MASGQTSTAILQDAYPPDSRLATPDKIRSVRTKQISSGPVLSRRISEVPAVGVHQTAQVVDIEHVPVENDPRTWSFRRKHLVLLLVSLASLCSALTANIFFPAIDSLQTELGISDTFMNGVVAGYILVQGLGPILWSAVSELKGRKIVYLASFALYLSGTIAASRAQNGATFLAMRILQAMGGSAVLAIGAGTLSDIFDSYERATKIGIYYVAPLLGPSVGSLLGGAFTLAGGWRSTFYALIPYGFSCLVAFIFFPESFRPERSKAYATAVKRAQRQADSQLALQKIDSLSRDAAEEDIPAVKITFRDANPLLAVGAVMRQPINALSILFSGILFAIQYSLAYTGARSFAAAPYSYNSLVVGAILLVLGVGSMFGSVLGGRYSDAVYNKMKARNNGVGIPIMRLLSTRLAMLFLPPSLVAYGWLVQYSQPIWWICIALFVIGMSSIWIYSSTLAFIVDANPGRSTSAVACNSAARGISGCAASFFAPAIVNSKIGNGGLYTIWAATSIILMGVLLLATRSKTRLP